MKAYFKSRLNEYIDIPYGQHMIDKDGYIFAVEGTFYSRITIGKEFPNCKRAGIKVHVTGAPWVPLEHAAWMTMIRNYYRQKYNDPSAASSSHNSSAASSSHSSSAASSSHDSSAASSSRGGRK